MSFLKIFHMSHVSDVEHQKFFVGKISLFFHIQHTEEKKT